MSYEKIKEAMETIQSTEEWSLKLISYKHKSRPLEYTCYPVSFINEAVMKDTILGIANSFMGVVEKYERRIENYNGMNSKNIIDKINLSNPLLSQQWEKLSNNMEHYDDTLDLKEIKSNAFIFFGQYQINDEERSMYLISRRDPIYTYKKGKGKIFASLNNRITEIEEPLLQFGKTADAIVFEGILYTINNNFETIFNMEYSHRVVCKNVLERIEEKDVIENFESYKKFALSGQQPRKFITFEQDILENIRTEESLKIMTEELHVPYNGVSRKFLLDDFKHAEVFTKALCGKTKHNMFVGGICEVPNSTPLAFS